MFRDLIVLLDLIVCFLLESIQLVRLFIKCFLNILIHSTLYYFDENLSLNYLLIVQSYL